MAAAGDGGFYVHDQGGSVSALFKISSTGSIKRVAGHYLGDGLEPASYLEGRLAVDTRMQFSAGMAEGPDNELYISSSTGQTFRIDKEGRLRSVAGSGLSVENNYKLGFGGDAGPARLAQLQRHQDIAFDQQGNLLIADTGNHRIRKVSSPFLVYSENDIFIASDNGAEIYVFDADGRHLRTLHGLTGNIIHAFLYSVEGYLIKITDADSNSIIIERDSENRATVIITAGGQRTELYIDGNDHLRSITNPAGESVYYTYSHDGLLRTRTDAKAHISTRVYNERGHLVKDNNAEMGGWNFERTELRNAYQVSKSSAMGRTTQYLIKTLANNDKQRINVWPDGSSSRQLNQSDNGTTIFTATDGSETTIIKGPDPRFGMQAPVVVKSTLKLPSGLTSIVTKDRIARYNLDQSLNTLTDTITINGRQQIAVINVESLQLKSTSAAGRISKFTINNQGRLLTRQYANWAPVQYSYDSRGRLHKVSQHSETSTRVTTMQYDENAYLDSVVDALGHVIYYDYDVTGRMIQQTLADDRIVQYNYDLNGNLTSLIPPGGLAHVFNYNSVNKESIYTPPAVNSVNPATYYEYNLDRQLDLITRPGGLELDYVYDNKTGQLTSLVLPQKTINYYYDSAGRIKSIATLSDELNSNTLIYHYDGFLMLSEELSGSITGKIIRSYDNNFWLKDLSVMNGDTVFTVQFEYDKDGLLLQAGDLKN